MKPFQRAVIEQQQIESNIELMFQQWQDKSSAVSQFYKQTDPEKAKQEIRATIENMCKLDEIWINDIYQVNLRRPEPGIVHLSIKRIDRKTIHDWRDLQRIKTELVGPENEAVEIYPAESRVVDTANQYHLWVFEDPTYRIPLGFAAGRIVCDKPLGNSVNRPFVRPPVAA